LEGIHGPDRVEYCCKKESIPYNFLDFFIHFPYTDVDPAVSENCSSSFVKRQIELDPKLKKGLELLESEDTSGNPNGAEAGYDDAIEKLVHVMTFILMNQYLLCTSNNQLFLNCLSLSFVCSFWKCPTACQLRQTDYVIIYLDFYFS
jgi:hypothetical protein